MPSRKTPLVSDHYYHVFNRSQHREPIFESKLLCQYFLKSLWFYKTADPPTKLSKFISLENDAFKTMYDAIDCGKQLVEVSAFCLMPNHFHILLKQLEDGGISRYLSQVQNSFTKAYNQRNDTYGHVFSGQFKTVHIETENQYLHTLRYILLNPYSGGIVKQVNDISRYPYSSFDERNKSLYRISSPAALHKYFPNQSDFSDFILNHADYQKSLASIKHLLLE
jgi:putative transposase